MRTRTILSAVAALLALIGGRANALVITAVERAYSVDGNTTPAGVVETLDASGLGSVAITLTGAGPHFVLGFFDYEIDEAINGFTNESGAAVGVRAAGQSSEIDEPGFAGVFGDIYDNFLANTLDNLIVAGPEDISMALGWNFVLATAETAVVTFIIDDVLPAAGFYLRQDDPRSEFSLSLRSTLLITGGVIEPPPPPPPTGIPEPTTLALLAAGLLSLGVRRRRA